MKIGIFAKTFAGTSALAVLDAARAAGFAAAQYNMACSGLDALPVAIDGASAQAVRAAAKATGVGIAAVSATYNMIHPDLAERGKGRRAFAAIAASARAMGTRLVTICTGSRDARDQWRRHPDNAGGEAWRDMLAEFERLLVVAERCDIDIGVEPELVNVVNSADLARALIDEMRSERIKIVLDPANLFEVAAASERAALVEHAVDALSGHIALAHAKDRYADGRFAAAGQGVIDFAHFLTTLHRAGFDGAVVAHGLSADAAPGVARFLQATLAALPARA